MRKQRVWVGMAAVDKVVGGPPCMKNGVDCTDRYPGCQGKCPEFADWKNRIRQEREAYYKENGGDLEADKYTIQSYNNMQRKMGEKPRER